MTRPRPAARERGHALPCLVRHGVRLTLVANIYASSMFRLGRSSSRRSGEECRRSRTAPRLKQALFLGGGA